MNRYSHHRAVPLAAMLLWAAAASAATPPAEPHATPDTAALERKLEAARERLEAAAREVAELSGALVPEELRDLELHIGHPRPMLGVQLGEVRAGGGVRINEVSPGGPAAAAGLKAGDVIVSVNGHPATGAAEVAKQVHALKPGEAAKLEVDRAGKIEQVAVATRVLDPRVSLLHGPLFDMHFPAFADGNFVFADHDELLHGGHWGGLELAPLSPDLGRYFGADKGLLVIRAPAGGALKLRDGDVVTAIDGREPDGVSHALRILRSYEPGEHLTLSILRDRKPQKLELTMPPAPPAAGHGPHIAPPAPPAPPAAPPDRPG